MTEFPVLETERLTFIEITKDSTTDIFDIFSNDNVTKYYNCYPFKLKEEALKVIDLLKERFKTGTGIRWGITLRNNKNIIGTIGFNRYQSNAVGILGYDLNEDYWKQGIISEAINKVIKYGFNKLHIHRIEAEVVPDNIASIKVLEKNAFTKEGTLRDKGFWKNEHHTLILYSKLRTDCLFLS